MNKTDIYDGVSFTIAVKK